MALVGRGPGMVYRVRDAETDEVALKTLETIRPDDGIT
jgi:hypothetical protein